MKRKAKKPAKGSSTDIKELLEQIISRAEIIDDWPLLFWLRRRVQTESVRKKGYALGIAKTALKNIQWTAEKLLRGADNPMMCGRVKSILSSVEYGLNHHKA